MSTHILKAKKEKTTYAQNTALTLLQFTVQLRMSGYRDVDSTDDLNLCPHAVNLV
jgi:hypothetical protein